VDAIFPHWFNSVLSEVEEAVFWDSARANLEADYAQVRRRTKSGEMNHFSVFALAAQPLLIRLGALLGDIVRAEVYQLHREPAPSFGKLRRRRLADEAAAKGLPAGPLTNKSVPEHRLVGVSCGRPMMVTIGNVGLKY
jgi:hypothetical protein